VQAIDLHDEFLARKFGNQAQRVHWRGFWRVCGTLPTELSTTSVDRKCGLARRGANPPWRGKGIGHNRPEPWIAGLLPAPASR
jgi:hypothetical protein